ncbi:SDR family NAD(P)-dependent oxidoreductase [Verminephrobacter eiseniae]|uniref:SDR family NAD(P)-dependent oxidoreductase n=1 Tax=Verminephrobacter eiseniae TaxID=364317 RepID=UPI002238F1D7|nr:SDR family oxidoreductase [Verminephrobacter eiseniae]MCW5233136.1 SDR family oxidoreductase [Verminephrobacter eiseniae]MCW5295309.1 SDR family oxidoreductase [Verminephrobacter eiseniae]MCW8183581.1 SDR family oxidoreductase [Verminephrobacter eiseniae]MCW8226279.1 SDR family oxidoreductase [Verminephrobacter eiseniae]MCW8233365.1 SDR family oxidoreductase [Verminephrobacter eiseniae]
MHARFAHKVAAVTGAASGLGRATALALAAEGARILLFDRDEAGLAETARACPGSVSAVGDASSAADIARAEAQALRELGPVELLVPAAGMLGPAKPAIELQEQEWDRLFAVNVKGPWLAARAFVPHMRQIGHGAICMFSSTAGLAGSPFLSGYSASKGAVVLLARSLALNHAAEKIRVNCVCPGTIDGPMTEASFSLAGEGQARSAREAAIRSRIPAGRFGAPQEVAAAVLYLLSDAAGFTTGVALPIDGGRLA